MKNTLLVRSLLLASLMSPFAVVAQDSLNWIPEASLDNIFEGASEGGQGLDGLTFDYDSYMLRPVGISPQLRNGPVAQRLITSDYDDYHNKDFEMLLEVVLNRGARRHPLQGFVFGVGDLQDLDSPASSVMIQAYYGLFDPWELLTDGGVAYNPSTVPWSGTGPWLLDSSFGGSGTFGTMLWNPGTQSFYLSINKTGADIALSLRSSSSTEALANWDIDITDYPGLMQNNAQVFFGGIGTGLLRFKRLYVSAWYGDADGDGVSDDVDSCPNTVLGGNVFVGSIETAVNNTFFEATGCSLMDIISDVVADCAQSTNHGQYVNCFKQGINDLEATGVITSDERKSLWKAGVKIDKVEKAPKPKKSK